MAQGRWPSRRCGGSATGCGSGAGRRAGDRGAGRLRLSCCLAGSLQPRSICDEEADDRRTRSPSPARTQQVQSSSRSHHATPRTRLTDVQLTPPVRAGDIYCRPQGERQLRRASVALVRARQLTDRRIARDQRPRRLSSRLTLLLPGYRSRSCRRNEGHGGHRPRRGLLRPREDPPTHQTACSPMRTTPSASTCASTYVTSHYLVHARRATD